MDKPDRRQDDEFSRSRLKDYVTGTSRRRWFFLGVLIVILTVPPVQALLLHGAGALIRYLASMIIPILALALIFWMVRRTKR
jgi:hypothetical protein